MAQQVMDGTWRSTNDVGDLASGYAAPAHLYRGPVQLRDGRIVDGILFPRSEAEGVHRDISAYGGWRAYTAASSRARRVTRE